jgi:hypothetical protein
MKRKALPILALLLLFGFNSGAVAGTITINDAGVVGIMEGKISGLNGSSVANELIIANEILAMGINQTKLVTNPSGVDCTGGSVDQSPCEYRTGANPYSATLVSGSQGADDDRTVNDPGVVYVLAKYDGPNAGYVLFHLPDFKTTTLPLSAYSIWGQNDTQFAFSHYAAFQAASVPDGGSAATLLGSVLVGFAMLRRKVGRG